MRVTIDARALEIVEEALDIDDAGARAAFVTAQCGDDAALHGKVTHLLDMDRTEFRLLPTESSAASAPVPESLPDRIGPFRVLGVIGRGGMGAVVRAERDDGVFQQTVAIKLIRRDLTDARASDRFAQERRILARLIHPGIARILDGGEQDGRPYLVMDHVDGGPITIELARRAAALPETLDAFEAVCEAVAHAHRNLVVHADIKPSNVIMAESGAVKLLDFGIARLIVDLDTEETGDPYPLTRGYAAPERQGGAQPTIAGDVYSLGVLLHEMLTGAMPEAGRLASAAPGDGRIPPSKLAGDLDAIVARALASDPAARYSDVGAMLADIRAYRADQPIAARSDAGWAYHAHKFARRHRRGLTLTGIAVAGLMIAAIVSTSLYFTAERARARADARFVEVRNLAHFMLFDLYDQLSHAPGTVNARAGIAELAGVYLDRLSAVPDAPMDLRLERARGYRRLATVEGISGTASLGEIDKARAALAKAEAILKGIVARDPDNVAAMEEMGWVVADRWTLLAKTESSIATNLEARRWFDAALKREPNRATALLGRLTTDKSEAYDLIKGADKSEAAKPILRAALARLQTLRVPPAWHDEARALEYQLQSKLGDATYYGGDLAGSLPYYERALAIADAELVRNGESPGWLSRRGEALWNISGSVEEIPGRRLEALAQAEKGIVSLRRVLDYGTDSNAEKKLAILYLQQGTLLADLNRATEGAGIAAQSIAVRQARLNKAPTDPTRLRDLAIAQKTYSDILDKAARKADACTAARAATGLWDRIEKSGDLAEHDRKTNRPDAVAAAGKYCAS